MGKYEKGVRQGDGLNNLSFNVYINDKNKLFEASVWDLVAFNSTRLNCLVYAEDLVWLSENKEGLQFYLDSLQIYCEARSLK